MASKRGISKPVISSPITQPTSQKPKSPPPSPPPAFSLKDIQDVIKTNFLELKAEVKEMLAANKEEVKELLEEEREAMTDLNIKNNKAIREDIIFAFQGLAQHVELMDSRMEEMIENAADMGGRMEEVENRLDATQDELIMTQYREMEFAIRIRGLREDSQQDLKLLVLKDIAANLGQKPELIGEAIEKIYRVNSRIAKQRNLPRDVVIYFYRRSIRNEIIQAFYKQRFQIAAQDVIILKEIPPKILRKRKDFSFLSDELKKRQIQFRWEIPNGISLIYDGIRYRLLTVAKARDFYFSVLKARSPSPLQLQLQESKISEEPILPETSLTYVMDQLERAHQEVKEQRMTRAAHKRKEKEQQRGGERPQSTTSKEPVGGARPKSSSTVSVDLQMMLQRLQAGRDGQAPDMEC